MSGRLSNVPIVLGKEGQDDAQEKRSNMSVLRYGQPL